MRFSGETQRTWIASLLVLVAICISSVGASSASAEDLLSTYLAKVQPSELFEGADRFGDLSGEPPIALCTVPRNWLDTLISTPISRRLSDIPESQFASWSGSTLQV